MDLTMKEAIQLILDFHYVSPRYWKELPIEDPLVCHFIKEGYATLDEKHGLKYVLSKEGDNFLHTYVQQISTAFIAFLKKNQLCCYDVDAVSWFANSYDIDAEASENLYDYISKNLTVYGYKHENFHQLKADCGRQFEKMD